MAETTASKETEELKAQLSALKADIAAITETLEEISGSRYAEGVEAIKSATKKTKKRAEQAVADAQKHVAERPIASVLIAFAVGFVVGKVIERR